MHKDIIVIGTSAGGLEALRTLFGAVPEGFGASVFVVLHTSPQSPGILADILARAGALPAVTVRTSERIRPGTIYVAQPDHHLVIEPGRVRATKGPKENRFRPAIDPLFRSAAQTYGARVIGVVLTGGLDDGTAGLWAVKHLGGTAIVQDPADAYASSMPESAMRHVSVDHCVPLRDIAPLLIRLITETPGEHGDLEMPRTIPIEVEIAKEQRALDVGVLELGNPSNFACPECHGVLLEVKEGTQVRFRCHTGHAYSPASLIAEVDDAVEDALWNAIRSLEEGALLMQTLAGRAGAGNNAAAAQSLRTSAERVRRQADLVREAAVSHTQTRPSEDGPV